MPEPTTIENTQASSSAILMGRSLLEIAWNRKSHLGLGIAVGLIVGLLYYVQTSPVYQSKAQMLVVKKRPDNVTGVDTRNLAIEDYVATHKTLIESPVIIDRAIQKRGLANLESLRDKEEVTEYVRKNLSVVRNRSSGAATTNVLDLSFRGSNAEETPIILNAIMESYQEYLDLKYRNISEETLKLVVNAQNVLAVDLRKQEEAYSVFRQDAPILLVRSKDGTSLAQDRLSTIEKKRTALIVRKAELQGYLLAMDNSPKQSDGQEALLAMVAEWTQRSDGDSNKTPERLTLHNQLYPLLLEEQKLMQTRGENHPEVENMRKRIEVARVYLASPTGPWRKVLEKPGDKDAAGPADMFRDYFKQQLNHLSVAEKLLSDLYKDEFDAARTLTTYEVKDEQFRKDIERTQKLFESIVKRLQEVELIKDVGGYDANIIAPPALGKKVHPSALTVFPAALALGGLVGFGLAFLAEVTDKRFRSVDEVRLRLGLPVVGQIPFLPNSEKATPQSEAAGQQVLDPILYAHHHPKSVEAESYRGVRTALYFNVHGKGHKVVQVTSPNSGDGKSTMAANLAISIAQSKKKVLLVDADMRRPSIHKLFGISSEVGLSSVIVEEVEPKDAIQATSIPGLSILPCGPIPPNPAELLTAPRFEELLGHLREQYDFVIVDTPPLLAVTDPSVVAHKVDGVFLNIRFTKNARPDAERAKEILHSLKAKVIGVVINDAEHLLNVGGYGYGYGNSYLEPAKISSDGPSVQPQADRTSVAK